MILTNQSLTQPLCILRGALFKNLSRRQRVGTPTGTPTNSVGEASGLILKKHTPSAG